MSRTSEFKTRVLGQDDRAIDEVVQALRCGGLVILPTDTVYGVGCDIWQPEAVARLYWAKRRPRHMAIPILLSSAEYVYRVARDLPERFKLVAARFWPGGLTLILPRHPDVPDIISAGKTTIAVRMPNHPLALRLIERMGGALAVTSANLSGKPASKTVEEALTDLDERVAIALDGGRCLGGVASTIIDLVSDPPRLLREGAVDVKDLRQVLPGLVVSE